MKSRVVTIKDIAEELNISVSTVSRAIRDTYDVNQETKEKVLAKAKELNYKPNFNATALSQGSTHNIGVVLPFINNYYFSTVFAGIQEIAYQKGYNVILFVTNDSAERELSIIKNIAISNLDGLLVSISSNSDSCNHFQEIINDGLPIVFFDRVPSNIDSSMVMQDDYNGAFEAVEHLISQGYRNIAHLGGPIGLEFTKRRLDGYTDALKNHNLPVDPKWILHSGFSRESGEIDTEKLLSSNKIPDAIFAVNDRKAVGAIIVMKNKNLKIGEEIGLIGFTNDPISELISPSLSTIEEPALEIGKKSCELLLKHIAKSNFTPQKIILPGKLIVRNSSMRKL